jgi:ferredoxin
VIGPAFASDLDGVTCVQCGQCAAICPVGAITERSAIDDVWGGAGRSDQDGDRADRAGDPRGAGRGIRLSARHARDGQDGHGPAPDGLRRGLRHELRGRSDHHGGRHRAADPPENGRWWDQDKAAALPMFTSCSPGWIQFAEFYYPNFLDHLSTCKSPQQMFGAVAKTYYAQKIGKKPEDLVVVSVMPCTAKKFERSGPR